MDMNRYLMLPASDAQLGQCVVQVTVRQKLIIKLIKSILNVWNEICTKVTLKKQGFPGGSVVKNMPVNTGAAGDMGLIPELGRSPGEGNSNPLQYSCQVNPMDRGAWRATVHGVKNSQT